MNCILIFKHCNLQDIDLSVRKHFRELVKKTRYCYALSCFSIMGGVDLTFCSQFSWNRRLHIQHENNSSNAYVVTVLFVGLNVFESQPLSFYLVTFSSIAALVTNKKGVESTLYKYLHQRARTLKDKVCFFGKEFKPKTRWRT